MKRWIKNLIMILITLLLIGGMIFAVNNAKNSNNVNNTALDSSNNQNNNQSNDSNPPAMPDNSNNQSDNQSNDSNPPAMPDSSNNQSDNQSNNGSNSPAMPDKSNNGLNVWYYVTFISLSFVISILVMYLILSKFNKKSFKETFKNKDKVVIEILSVIILTSILTGALSLCTSKKDSKVSSNISYSASTEITKNTTITSGNYSSSTVDENAILISDDVKVSNISVNKSGDSNGGDNTSFYGTNSAITVKDGANAVFKNITVKTNATGANGVFSFGGNAATSNSSSDGTSVTISNSKITTNKDNSGGIMTTGGGTMNATNLTILTKGTSSAAIRTDRGGGNVTVNKGTYTTTGQGSPAIYSTANINVKNASLISKASEGVVIEGKNSVTLDKCILVDTNNKLNGKSTTYKNIFLYQSMSGDADNGTASFSSKNSKITTNKGDSFYVTNTTASITLENNTIKNNDKSGNFLRIQKDSWGNSGSNGGDVTLNLKNQVVRGNIVVDSISTLDMNLKDSSSYTGTINNSNSAKSIKLSLDKSSKIKLTGDSYITSFNNKDTTNSNIDFNGYKLYVNGKAIN